MRERVELISNAGLDRERSRVEVMLKGDRIIAARADAAKGTPKNPAVLDDLRAKYLRCVEGRLADSDAHELLDLLVRVDELDELGRLFELLGSAHHRSST